MSDSPDIEETVGSERATRRAWTALGLAEALFAVTFPPCALLALRLPAASEGDGWGQLALFATFLVCGAVAVLAGIPLAVHTAGRYTAHLTDGWPRVRAALAHLAVGLFLGWVAADIIMGLGPVPFLPAMLAFALPSGLAAFGTHLLMPLAIRHRWVRVTSWVIGALPLGAALVGVVAVALGNF